MPRKKNSEIEEREDKFRDWITHAPLSKRIPLRDFLRDIGFEFHPGRAEKKPPNGLSVKQIQTTVEAIEKDFPDRRVLEIFGVTTENPSVEVKTRDLNAFERRLSRAQKQKKRIAESLWDFLLFRSNGGSYELVCNAGVSESKARLLQERIISQREKLIRRSQLFFGVDAGTTTLTIVEELLRVDDLPLVIKLRTSDDLDEEDIRLMGPVLLTNSIPIVNTVYKNEKLRGKIATRIIGGDLRPTRQCVAGNSSTQWLRMLKGTGDIGVLDLSIVGATGVRMDGGVAYGGCDDHSEATLKSELLDLAGSSMDEPANGMRVVVLHSSKILYPENRCYFTALTKATVDLVVTDQGEDSDEELVIGRFCECLNRNGVAVLKASLK